MKFEGVKYPNNKYWYALVHKSNQPKVVGSSQNAQQPQLNAAVGWFGPLLKSSRLPQSRHLNDSRWASEFKWK